MNYLALTVLLDLRKTKNILDVGAGYGFLVKMLSENAWMRASGVEPSSQEAQYAQNKLGLDVRQSMLSAAGHEKESFDVLVCCEVIEHVPDPIIFVRELTEYLRPGGRLVIMTDNFEAAAVKRMKAEWPKWIPHSHVSHFSDRSLRKCISDAGGLTIERELSYTPWENTLKSFKYAFRKPRPAHEVFSLSDVLKQEMAGSFPLFRLRFMSGKLWFRMTRHNDLSGSLMYIVAQKS